MARRIRHAAYEFVPARYVERATRKGWMERAFNIGGRWYVWRKNIETEAGVYRFGVPDWDGSYEATLERS